MAVGVSPTLFVQPGQSHQVEEYWTTLIKVIFKLKIIFF